MSNPENPFDHSLWDPISPEHAIEDPFHGPSAVFDMLQNSPIPLGDGTYYQEGLWPSNPYFDSLGRPVLKYKVMSADEAHQQTALITEWIETREESGNEALLVLEGHRQNERMTKTGFAHCFKATDVCPGNNKLEDCSVGRKAYDEAQKWGADKSNKMSENGTFTNVLAWAGGKCVGCAVSCEVSVKTVDGNADETRVTFYIPDPSIPVIHINLDTFTAPIVD